MEHHQPVCEHLGQLERFEAVFYYAGAAIAIADRTGRLGDTNPAFADLLERPMDDLIGRHLTDVFDPSANDRIRDAVSKLGQDGDPGTDTVEIDASYKNSHGARRWALLTINRIIDRKPCLVIVGMDITWRRELRERLYHQSRHDPLTGLPNRAYLEEQLDKALREHRSIGACLADMDGFKQVNDVYGHGPGDRLLISIAGQLRRELEPGRHIVGRIGGDEFIAIVFDPSDVDELAKVADRMQAACCREYPVNDHRVVVSASIGIAVPDPARTTLDDLIRAADVGLYRAKAASRRYTMD